MADSKRCVWERLQMVEAEPFGEEASVTMMLIAWVSVCGHRSVSVLDGEQQIVLIKRGAANSTGSRKALSVCVIWYMKSTCTSLFGGSFYVCIDQPLFTPIDGDFVKCTLLCVLSRDLTLFALHSASLFSSSNLPPAENVITLLSLVTFSLFQQMTKLLLLLLLSFFLYILYSAPHAGISNRSLVLLLKDKC